MASIAGSSSSVANPTQSEPIRSSAEQTKTGKAADLAKMKLAIDSVALLCGQALGLTESQMKFDVNQAFQTLLQDRAKQENELRNLNERMRDLGSEMAELEKADLDIKKLRRPTDAELAEVEKQIAVAEKMKTVFRKTSEFLLCPFCQETSELPKVLSAGGQISCEDCVIGFDEYAFNKLNQFNSAYSPVSAKQHMQARTCPLTRTLIVARGFPVNPLRDIAFAIQPVSAVILADDDLKRKSKVLTMEQFTREIARAKQNRKQIAKAEPNRKQKDFKVRVSEEIHKDNILLDNYATIKIAKCLVTKIIATVTNQQWCNGVYIEFAINSSKLLYEETAVILHGKAGGVNVLINSSQRLLVVQLKKQIIPRYIGNGNLQAAIDRVEQEEKLLRDIKSIVDGTPANQPSLHSLKNKIKCANDAIEAFRIDTSRYGQYGQKHKDIIDDAVERVLDSIRSLENEYRGHLYIMVDSVGGFEFQQRTLLGIRSLPILANESAAATAAAGTAAPNSAQAAGAGLMPPPGPVAATAGPRLMAPQPNAATAGQGPSPSTIV